MTKRNTDGLAEYNKTIKAQKEQDVIKAINTIRKAGKKITLAAVCEEASVSRAYFQKNPEMLKLVDKYRNPSGTKKVQSQDAKDTIIISLKAENRKLRNELKAIDVNDNYKIKYEESLEKIALLEKQLDEALKMNLDLDF